MIRTRVRRSLAAIAFVLLFGLLPRPAAAANAAGANNAAAASVALGARARVREHARAMRRELSRAEAQLKHRLARLPADSGVQVLHRPEGVLLRVPARILFAPDSATLRRGDASAALALTAAVQLLKRRPRLSAQIDVYTDDIGGAALNRSVSEQRAQAVAAALHAAGVAVGRLRPRGGGLQDALASNDTPEGRMENRRVEIVFSPEPATAPAGG